MMRLRPFKPQDVKYIIRWIPTDERDFTMWSAGRIKFPAAEEILLKHYESYTDDDNAWVMTALDDFGKPVGCLLMRMADYEKNSVHLGFIIVDRRLKIRGLGREMVSLAVKYAFEILKMQRVTLTVFPINEKAHRCYKSVGMCDEKYHEDAFEFRDEKWDAIDMAIVNSKNHLTE